MTDVNLYSREIEALVAHKHKLEAALKRYGLHTWDCNFNDSRGERPCNCGWAELEQSLLRD